MSQGKKEVMERGGREGRREGRKGRKERMRKERKKKKRKKEKVNPSTQEFHRKCQYEHLGHGDPP